MNPFGRISRYVIEDGRRVILQIGLLKALGMSTGGAKKLGARKIDEFINNPSINKFIVNDLNDRASNVIKIKTTGGALADAYEATMDTFLDAMRSLKDQKWKQNDIHKIGTIIQEIIDDRNKELATVIIKKQF